MAIGGSLMFRGFFFCWMCVVYFWWDAILRIFDCYFVNVIFYFHPQGRQGCLVKFSTIIVDNYVRIQRFSNESKPNDIGFQIIIIIQYFV